MEHYSAKKGCNFNSRIILIINGRKIIHNLLSCSQLAYSSAEGEKVRFGQPGGLRSETNLKIATRLPKNFSHSRVQCYFSCSNRKKGQKSDLDVRR